MPAKVQQLQFICHTDAQTYKPMHQTVDTIYILLYYQYKRLMLQYPFACISSSLVYYNNAREISLMFSSTFACNNAFGVPF